jgi:homoserine kinase
VRARSPASAANLGPGFDALAVALSLYVEVEVTPADRLTVAASGHGADLPTNATHLAAQVVARVLGHDRAHIAIHSDVPVGRGLGSSAALAVAAAAAAGASDPLAHGARADGHPENAAAAALGGLVAAATVMGRPVVRRLPLDSLLRFVVVVPDRQLPTPQARAVLPRQVSHADAAFNLGRMGLLVAGLGDRRKLVPEAFEDRLHQAARSGLFAEGPALLSDLSELADRGALGACWSGAGPSLLVVCTRATVGDVREGTDAVVAKRRLPAQVLALQPDLDGVILDPPRRRRRPAQR